MYSIIPRGVCSRRIQFDVIEKDGEKYVKDISFIGGCSGNTQGVAKLAEGMKIKDVISRLDGISCGGKPTSCPDQFAKALKAYL